MKTAAQAIALDAHDIFLIKNRICWFFLESYLSFAKSKNYYSSYGIHILKIIALDALNAKKDQLKEIYTIAQMLEKMANLTFSQMKDYINVSRKKTQE